MSRQHVNAYRAHLAKLHAVSGSLNEGVVSAAFGKLLESWGRSLDLTLVNQWQGKGPRGNAIRVDGALVPGVLRIPFGYWEAKDSKDDLDREIAKKRAAGYPTDNIVYEDTREAVLVQNNVTVDRAAMADDVALLKLLDRFFAFQRPEIAEFRKAARQFKADLPVILDALRHALDSAEASNAKYVAAAADFLAHAKSAINPMVTAADVREMLIQHILTEEIFTSVFDDAQFHRQNNVARRITALEDAFFTRTLRGATKDRLRPYYNAIRSAAADTTDRREKQTFVKNLYEDFYKVYNPKAADRLGVVYTPGEIVRFMIRGADWLCEKHFDKCLIDPGVEILDPATGTGTFIVELLDHFAGAGPDKLRHKYTEELHANEVAILPYYVANLNIEASYAAITGQYAEFPGLVFVDTLDNTPSLQPPPDDITPFMFGSFSDENISRIRRQNERKISVVIGNPPYNAWQENYNSRNPNRPYQWVDSRIGATYRKQSNAQNTSSLSDMYVRFYRWVSDRLRDDGIVAFVTNRNFIDKLAFDGFRKSVAAEFAEVWLVDLGGDVRANPKLSGTKHNAMGIQTGLTIAFMVRSGGKRGPATIRYARRPEDETADDKRAWLNDVQMDCIGFRTIRPDKNGVWLDQSDGDWATLLSVADPTAGPRDSAKITKAIFRLSSNGLTTQRDEWVWDWNELALSDKIESFIEAYEAVVQNPQTADRATIKWDRETDHYIRRGVRKTFAKEQLITAQFRPFIRKKLYFDQHLNAMTYRLP